jgi:hypothetical protein
MVISFGLPINPNIVGKIISAANSTKLIVPAFNGFKLTFFSQLFQHILKGGIWTNCASCSQDNILSERKVRFVTPKPRSSKQVPRAFWGIGASCWIGGAVKRRLLLSVGEGKHFPLLVWIVFQMKGNNDPVIFKQNTIREPTTDLIE